MKAMQFSPDDRYPNVRQLAGDIEAYLGDQPVSAWREPLRIRAQRFLRQRQSLVLAGMLLLALLAALSVTIAYRQERVAKRLAAKQAETVSQVSEIFASLKLDGHPTGLLGRDYKDPDLRRAAERVKVELSDNPTIQASLLDAVGDHFSMSGKLQDAEAFLIPALEIRNQYPEHRADLASSLHHVAFLRWIQGRVVEARRHASQAIAIRSEVFGANHEKTIASQVLYLMLICELPEMNDQRVLHGGLDRFIRAWQQVLEAEQARIIDTDRRTMSEADIGGIYTVLALCHAYRLFDSEANLATQWSTGTQAMSDYRKGQAAFAKAKGNHPGELFAKTFQSRISSISILQHFVKQDAQALLAEAIELSKQTFHANESHPGNLVVRRHLVQGLGDGPEEEKAMREVRELAKPVFEGEPRAANFDSQLAELLFHRGMATESPAEREAFFEESQMLFEGAIECWAQTIGTGTMQVGEARKKLARIARERGDLQVAERLFRSALAAYDLASIRGYDYCDHQCRGELARVLVELERLEEAEELVREREQIRAEHLARIPEIVERIYSGVGSLGLED